MKPIRERGKGREGRHRCAQQPPGYQPANPAPDGATRGNLARTGANFGARQDGPVHRRRTRPFGDGDPAGVAPFETETAETISDEDDQATEPDHLDQTPAFGDPDRKSTRLNSRHLGISYAV